MSYSSLTLRNNGYISPQAQQRIRETRLLIAGCGMGSVFAETAIRMGYEKLILVDHDRIEPHNLNRQNFTGADIGSYKVEALAARLRAINPEAQIEALRCRISPSNAAEIVSGSDLVFDTIDFIDLPGLVALHDASQAQSVPLITALSAGFGAVALYFGAVRRCTIRDLFGLPATGSVEQHSYVERFASYIETIAHLLDPTVIAEFSRIASSLRAGRPCPAAQVAAGATCVAALSATIAARIAEDQPVREAPELLIANLSIQVSVEGATGRTKGNSVGTR